jgi:hypothetical protein
MENIGGTATSGLRVIVTLPALDQPAQEAASVRSA